MSSELLHGWFVAGSEADGMLLEQARAVLQHVRSIESNADVDSERYRKQDARETVFLQSFFSFLYTLEKGVD